MPYDYLPSTTDVTDPHRGPRLVSVSRRRDTSRRCGRRVLPIVILAILGLAPLSAAAQAATPPAAPAADATARRVITREELGIDARVGYSGDRIVESTEAGRTIALREHRMPGKARLEFEHEGQQVVMILDEAAGNAYMLLPALSAYTTISVQEYQARAYESLDLLDFEALGREKVNGYDATRYRISWRDPDGNQGHGFHWVTDAGVAIRMDVTYDSPEKSGERVVLDLKNLVVAPQDPALFERPAGYVALPSIAGLLDTLPGLGGGAEGTGGIDLERLQEGLSDLLKSQ